MGMQVWTDGTFKVYRVKRGYVLHNSKLPFESGHTHLRNPEICKKIARDVAKNKIPRVGSIRLLVSAMRVSDNPEYIAEIQEVIDKKIEKKKLKGVGR